MISLHASDIQEYLLLKGVEAVAIHGSKCTLVSNVYSDLRLTNMLDHARKRKKNDNMP